MSADKKTTTDRLKVRKTYKLYVNGAFVRSERGRYLTQMDAKGEFVSNYSWASRKDFRDAVVAARKAFSGWSKRSAFNRSQILYRAAEMLEDRREVFEGHLAELIGLKTPAARREVDAAIDRFVYFAGWADKYGQILSSVNPIGAPYFNFSMPEPTGVVTVFASRNSPLVGIVAAIAPVILSGNTVIVVVENQAPTLSIDLAEVLATSDLPAGIVNILTGRRAEIIPFAAEHMDVNAIASFGSDNDERRTIQEMASDNVKRVHFDDDPAIKDWHSSDHESLYKIVPFIEIKTAWHPIGV
ncbi:MAG TPA: aldehyde dehydrogenase family protein [Rhodothermales bacterium]|nr:aldehyde dehydrogenase family protein [Rhodothermales bacterium]